MQYFFQIEQLFYQINNIYLANRPDTCRQAKVSAQAATGVVAKKQEFASFDDMVAGSDVPLLVDFYATW